MNTDIQQSLDSGKSIISLPSGEFQGPFYINKPCIVEGNNTTLWNNKENVLVINSDGVQLKNLRIELINSAETAFSVVSEFAVKTENVEIIGKVSGFGIEDSVPDMEKQIKLGKFKPETTNSFCFEVFSPGDGVLISEMKDIKIKPEKLVQGMNIITLSVEPLPAKTLIYGDIILKTAFNRRFYISGRTSEDAEQCQNKNIITLKSDVVILQESMNSRSANQASRNVTAGNYPVKSRNENISSNTGKLHILTRGERISLEDYISDTIKISMGYRALFKQMDIDPYAFMLNESGVTSCDDDFVFWGNRDTKSGALTFNEDKTIDLVLARVPEHISSVSLVYSIYKPEARDNFSKVLDPFITVSQNGNAIVKYTAQELFAETTIIFLEIYRYKNNWKLNTIGQGYKEGLKRLCANYGLMID